MSRSATCFYKKPFYFLSLFITPSTDITAAFWFCHTSLHIEQTAFLHESELPFSQSFLFSVIVQQLKLFPHSLICIKKAEQNHASPNRMLTQTFLNRVHVCPALMRPWEEVVFPLHFNQTFLWLVFILIFFNEFLYA